MIEIELLGTLNWLAVVVATGAAFAIGSVWFAPPVLGDRWAAHAASWRNMTVEQLAQDSGITPRALGVWTLGMFVSVVALALVNEVAGADNAVDGIVNGAILWIGFATTFSLWQVAFTRMPWKLWWLNNAAGLLMQVAAGAILGGWQ